MQRKQQDIVEMEISIPSPAPIATMNTILKPNTPGEYVAYGISQVGSPPVLGLFALILITTTLTLTKNWPWLGLYILLNVITPVSYLIWQLRHGQITDLDVHLREQRKASLLVTLAGATLSWFAMMLGDAPPELTFMAGVGMVQWTLIFAITLRWKISIHATSATGVTMIILRIFGLSAAPLAISIPLVAWSRIKLRHHTPAQTVAGTLLGFAIFMLGVLISPVY